ncbi:HAD family hydrolase [Pectinatus cerevisiiphilus]|uniref:HAD superfamily hydrolase (TIGR01509 family)/HAD superfamily hydrolase (TIGR01549 family)/beta-phosphoglucomutase family hydrolase n=1 Tax=Pectinatus cerevisiiphilus TaxID=86956 RepID=A0A4R3KEN2_9FIRM|nr:HAD family phosphatase [Pectinatus cerevisiiphilus]TCS81419.1 HAD superfamily hydrolase (TIGR01509 family)/HAD superfamily hydrolase (TIGR01549 family)/beta-phosphoglucomutase family hydrolase [Pectinatus cerevisiiphilus]
MKAVIFDMDGVIVDSETIHIKMKIQALKEYGIECSPKECMAYFGRSSNAFFSDFIKKASADIPLQEIVARKHQLFLQYASDNGAVEPIDGALDLIKELRSKNIPLALASSSVRYNIEWFLKKFGVFDCFDVILSGAELTESKPNPEIYLLAAQKLGIKPQECVVIEDAEAGIKAAKSAACYCIAYCNPAYKDCGQDASAADMRVNSLKDISIEKIMNI